MKSLLTFFLVVLKLSFAQAQDPWTAENDSLLRIISHSDVDSVKAHAYSQLKEVWQTKNFRKAIAYGHQALYYAKKGKSKKQTIGMMFQLAWAYMSIGNAAASIDILQQIIPLTKDDDLDGHGTALSFIAMNYVVLKDYENALKFMREATDLEMAMNAQGKYLGQISHLGSRLNMATVFVGKNQVDSALHYGKIAYQRLQNEKQLGHESQHFLWNIPHIYGDAHRKAKHHSEAMKLYREALQYAKKQNHQTGISSVKLSLAYLFEQMQVADSSLAYAHEALAGFEKSNDYPQLSEAGLLLHQLYKHKKNATKALQYFEIGMAARDSVMNRDKILQVQYLTDKQERQKREIEIEKQQIQVRQQLYMLLAGLISFVVIALIVYRNYRQQKRLNAKIEALNEGLEQKVHQRTAELQTALNEVQTAFDKGQTTERKRVSADLHDEIGSALSTIAIFSDVTRRKAQKTAPALVNELEKIGKKSREMMQTMRDTIWTLNDDSSQNIWERMYQYSLEALTAKEISLNWQVPDDAPNNLPFSIKRNLFLAYKEAIHNIVKHAEATIVNVECLMFDVEYSFSSNIKHQTLSITDNGKGFDIETARNEGNGLQNFQKRMTEIGGSVQIESKIGEGTKLIFKIPATNP